MQKDQHKHKMAEFVRQHTLSPERRQALIEAKIERARTYSQAQRQLERRPTA